MRGVLTNGCWWRCWTKRSWAADLWKCLTQGKMNVELRCPLQSLTTEKQLQIKRKKWVRRDEKQKCCSWIGAWLSWNSCCRSVHCTCVWRSRWWANMQVNECMHGQCMFGWMFLWSMNVDCVGWPLQGVQARCSCWACRQTETPSLFTRRLRLS